MISSILFLGFILSLPFLRPAAPRTDPQAWQALRVAFEARGVVIRSDHPRCQEPSLHGLYVRGQRTLVVCNRGDRSHTLRHEGWHLAQSLCLMEGPWLSNSAITQALTRQDRLELQALVQPERWRREAEARAMANQSLPRYLQALEQACQIRLPPAGASPASAIHH